LKNKNKESRGIWFQKPEKNTTGQFFYD